MATLLGAVIAFSAGITGAYVQASGNEIVAQEKFLRTQQQAAYRAFLQDEHALTSAERSYTSDATEHFDSAAYRDAEAVTRAYKQ